MTVRRPRPINHARTGAGRGIDRRTAFVSKKQGLRPLAVKAKALGAENGRPCSRYAPPLTKPARFLTVLAIARLQVIAVLQGGLRRQLLAALLPDDVLGVPGWPVASRSPVRFSCSPCAAAARWSAAASSAEDANVVLPGVEPSRILAARPRGARRLRDSTLSTRGIFNNERNGPHLRQRRKAAS